MAKHGYEAGRLNLPFVGHCSFAKKPIVTDWTSIDADVAILGVPFDMGTQYRAGARFGPRGIREASTLFSFGHSGAYDFEDDVVYLPVDKVRIVDAGDVDMVHTDTMRCHANTEAAVRRILKSGALPVMLGGDHAIHAPCMAAFSEHGPLHIVHFDAHLDFVDERHGVRYGHGNTRLMGPESSDFRTVTGPPTLIKRSDCLVAGSCHAVPGALSDLGVVVSLRR